MKRKDILNMENGFGMDVLVHEKYFPAHIDDPLEPIVEIPQHSINALDLMETLRKKCIFLSVSTREDEGGAMGYQCSSPSHPLAANGDERVIRGKTFSEVVCKAALIISEQS